MAGGRPLKFKTPEELEAKANEYFNSVPDEEWMVTGLALHLDTSRETLINYENKDEFFDTVKKLKQKIDYAYEKRGMHTRSSFDIFRMKNMGWTDHSTKDVKLDTPQPLLGGITNVSDDDGGTEAPKAS